MTVRSQWAVDQTEATSRGGMVAAKTGLAAEAGAAVLAKGGNAVDAAATMCLVAGVVEPWMTGIGGGGYMVIHQPGETAATVISYPMQAPAGAAEDMFPLDGKPVGSVWWPSVTDNANVYGHRSVAIPGTIAGVAMALRRFGTISFAEAAAPAIDLAERGFPVDWHTTLIMTRDLALLNRFAETRRTFTNEGAPILTLDEHAPAMVRQPDLARTLSTIADQGPRAFYEGDIAGKIADELSANGMPFTREDLARYQPTLTPALSFAYGDAVVHTNPGHSGGTTLAQAMLLIDALGVRELEPGTDAYLHLIAEAIKTAFADRFAYLADPEFVDVPYDQFVSDAYRDIRLGSIDRERATPARQGNRADLGITHNLVASNPAYLKDGSTTHHSVIDRNGMAVSTTQTLLSLWGSGVTIPGTGILMNNGMMWFDPEPGRPNSIAGGKKPLSNMSPAVVTRNGQALAAVGASGGRRIMSCVAQIVCNLVDRGMTMQPATSAPRIDRSTPTLSVSPRLGETAIAGLRSRGHDLKVKDERQLLGDYSSPASVRRDPDGTFTGGVDAYYVSATAVGVD